MVFYRVWYSIEPYVKMFEDVYTKKEARELIKKYKKSSITKYTNFEIIPMAEDNRIRFKGGRKNIALRGRK